MKKIVMTGGGTGGHIIPNLALIPELKKDYKIYYFGEANSMEQNLTTKDKDITFVEIPAVRFVRKLTFKNFCIPFKLIYCIRKIKRELKKIKPNIIFSKGGYVSLPVAFAGSKLKIPILTHESDYSVGLANKIIMKKAKFLFTSFRETCISNKCLYTGSPIRPQIFKGNKEIALKKCYFKDIRPCILFFGGSSGSKNINNFVFKNIERLSDYNIIHFVGKNNTNELDYPNYFQIDFAENIYDYFALADIVVCRAGANSIFELLALRKLMILIPLSINQSRGDQLENSNQFKKMGYAQVIQEKDLTIDELRRKIKNGLNNRFYYTSNMNKSPQNFANKLICDYIRKYSLK